MKFKLRRIHAFSLVEVTLALGIAAFCLIAVFGLVPVGVQTNRNATSQTAATNILSSVVSDIRASPPGQGKSAIYKINRSKSNNTTLYFDGGGECSVNLNGSTKVDGTSWIPPLQTRYRLYVATDATVGGVLYPQHAWLRVSWPAAADPLATPPVRPSGSVETVAAYFVK
jgi:type II secretory pathway pseudopilin PulG